MRHRGRHQHGIADRSELNQPHTVAIRIHYLGGHLQRKPGLADAADANDGQQSLARQQPLDLDQLPFAADERRQWLGQIRILAAAASVLVPIVGECGDGADKAIAPPRQRLDPMLAARRSG